MRIFTIFAIPGGKMSKKENPEGKLQKRQPRGPFLKTGNTFLVMNLNN